MDGTFFVNRTMAYGSEYYYLTKLRMIELVLLTRTRTTGTVSYFHLGRRMGSTI